MADGFCDAVEVRRGNAVESMHRAAAVVVTPAGRLVARLGDPDVEIYWRSAAKPFQAWPLIESGAADALGLTVDDVALACASHGGEDLHVQGAAAFLHRLGLDEADLQCGSHAPMYGPAAAALVRRGEKPGPLHNNCSGKHAGMLALGRHLGAPGAAYLTVDGAVQGAIKESIARHAQMRPEDVATAVDGCSAPTFRLPLMALARSYAALAEALTGEGGDSSLERVGRAMTARPELVAGSGRLDTLLMRRRPGILVAKLGAEGVHAVALAGPQGPLGLALKVADGADRARRFLLMELMAHLGWLRPEEVEELRQEFPCQLRNQRGLVIGSLTPRLEEVWRAPGEAHGAGRPAVEK